MTKPWLLVVAVTGMILTGTAFAHAKLQSTTPAAGAQLKLAPTSLTLRFNEKVRLAVLTLSVDGRAVPVTVDRSAPAAAQVSVALPVLAVGKYSVQWSVLSADDGHVSKGTFAFAVGPAVAAAAVLASPSAHP